MVRQIVTAAHRHGKWVGILRGTWRRAALSLFCLGWEADEFSMSGPRIPGKTQLRQLDMATCRALADKACDSRSAEEIEALLADFTPEAPPRPLLALETIVVNEPLTLKEQVLQFLCGNLAIHGRTENPLELEEDLWQREEIVTTAAGFGVAILTPNRNGYAISSISIARLDKAIDWESVWATSSW